MKANMDFSLILLIDFFKMLTLVLMSEQGGLAICCYMLLILGKMSNSQLSQQYK